MPIKFLALPTDRVRALQAGAPDANGQIPERKISDGKGNPCRHCLSEIAEGKEMLVLAYRPFSELQPYAELGPIFLCAEPCERRSDAETLPALYRGRDGVLLRGYTAADRILYGTGQVVPVGEAERVAGEILAVPGVAYLHMRSATNNCFQCRIERA